MKKTNMINAPLSAVIATLGHTDGICVADAGLPIPTGPQRIDLALRPGIPSFMEVLGTVLEEQVAERAVAAAEVVEKNPRIYDEMRVLLGDIPIDLVPHEEFKRLTADSRAVVRSGECTPYANVILYSGVPF